MSRVRIGIGPLPPNPCTVNFPPAQTNPPSYLACTLKQFEIDFAELPSKYPYAAPDGTTPGTRKIHYVEFRAQRSPHHDLGVPGDIWLDLSPGSLALYMKAGPISGLSRMSEFRGWFQWLGEVTKLHHPNVPSRYLWLTDNTNQWLPQADVQRWSFPTQVSDPTGTAVAAQAIRRVLQYEVFHGIEVTPKSTRDIGLRALGFCTPFGTRSSTMATAPPGRSPSLPDPQAVQTAQHVQPNSLQTNSAIGGGPLRRLIPRATQKSSSEAQATQAVTNDMPRPSGNSILPGASPILSASASPSPPTRAVSQNSSIAPPRRSTSNVLEEISALRTESTLLKEEKDHLFQEVVKLRAENFKTKDYGSAHGALLAAIGEDAFTEELADFMKDQAINALARRVNECMLSGLS